MSDAFGQSSACSCTADCLFGMCFSATEVTRNIQDVGLVFDYCCAPSIVPGVDSWLDWCRKASFEASSCQMLDIAVAYFRAGPTAPASDRDSRSIQSMPWPPTRPPHPHPQSDLATTPSFQLANSVPANLRGPIDPSWLKIPAAVKRKSNSPSARFDSCSAQGSCGK
jgi:hypothetical protein